MSIQQEVKRPDNLNPLTLWQWWVTPRSQDDETAFRERTIRTITILVGTMSAIGVLIALLYLPISTESMIIPDRIFQLSLATTLMLFNGVLLSRGHITLAGLMIVLVPTAWTLLAFSRLGYWSATTASEYFLTIILAFMLLPTHHYRKVVFIACVIPLIFIFLQENRYTAAVNPATYAQGYAFYDTSWNPIVATILTSGFAVVIGALLLRFIAEMNKRRDDLNALVATLEQRVETRTRELENSRNQLQKLYRLSREVNASLTYDEVLAALTDTLDKRDCNIALVIYQWQGDQSTRRVVASIRPPGSPIDLDGLTLPNAKFTKEHRDIFIFEDIDHSDNLTTEAVKYFRSLHVKSMMVKLVKVGGREIAAITMASHNPRTFSVEEQSLFRGLGDLVASTLERIHLYDKQVKLAEMLRKSDNIKSQFLASTSHELRTPLNAILNFSKFLMMNIYGEVNEQQRETLDKIVKSGDHLLALINDVLDITKIESNMLQLFVEDRIDIGDELMPVIDNVSVLIESKAVELITDIDANLPQIVGDRRRIRQIMFNLLSNAGKFTETGSITVSVKQRGDDILFVVMDTGSGIPKDKLNIIFEPFQQTEKGIRHAGGTGLGLAITKKLVDAHHGRIWVDTEVGEGSAFFVSLPIRSPHLVALIERNGVN